MFNSLPFFLVNFGGLRSSEGEGEGEARLALPPPPFKSGRIHLYLAWRSLPVKPVPQFLLYVIHFPHYFRFGTLKPLTVVLVADLRNVSC